eukprot:PhF_6_TR25350/c0_g1_i1/m.35072
MAHDNKDDHSGVQWIHQQGPYLLLSFFEENGLEQSQVAEISHLIRYEIFPNPFAFYERVEEESDLSKEPLAGDVAAPDEYVDGDIPPQPFGEDGLDTAEEDIVPHEVPQAEPAEF